MSRAVENRQLLIGKPTSIEEHTGEVRETLTMRLERYASIYAKLEAIQVSAGGEIP
jgi:hypothetical protein